MNVILFIIIGLNQNLIYLMIYEKLKYKNYIHYQTTKRKYGLTKRK